MNKTAKYKKEIIEGKEKIEKAKQSFTVIVKDNSTNEILLNEKTNCGVYIFNDPKNKEFSTNFFSNCNRKILIGCLLAVADFMDENAESIIKFANKE